MVRATVKLIGRNFDASEFGASKNTMVCLKNGAIYYNCTITYVCNYCIDFTVPICPIYDGYIIEASNDGGTTWVSLSSQTFRTITTNDGEAIMFEPAGGGTKMCGGITIDVKI